MGKGLDWYDLRCVSCGDLTPHLAIKDKGQFRCMVCDELFGSQRPIRTMHKAANTISPEDTRKTMTNIRKSLRGHTG